MGEEGEGGEEGMEQKDDREVFGKGADLFAAALMFVGALLQRTYCFWGR